MTAGKTSLLYHNDHTPHLFINVNDKPYKLRRIYFYDDNEKIICSLNYFDDHRAFIYSNDTNLRRKMNFQRKENFIIKSQIPAYNREYDLYIYHKNTSIQYRKKVVKNMYNYDSQDVILSRLYKKFLIGDYIHFEYVKSLSRKKLRLQATVEGIIEKELFHMGVFKPKPKEKMDEILNSISKLNDRIYEENQKLILRERLTME